MAGNWKRFGGGIAALCLVVLWTALLAAALQPPKEPGEEAVALDKLPAPVLAAVKARFPAAKLESASKETENGKTVYEVTFKDGGRSVDATFSADGKLISIERMLDPKDLPAAVAATLKAKFPEATVKQAEEVIKVQDGKETLAYYEMIVVGKDNKEQEVQVLPDGKLKEGG